ncbi:ribonuclease [Streptomyces armeniacus]|uniref:Ribonuclease n=1 Tax=Streptomyces armeniacus TaxID=83291 RepID=A0A345XNU4_9ACTN|nr:endonuclease [Streptomyces armeniacus]AXK33310.1 ribonuclease [Streptomyces armeniacus]
MHLPRPTRRKSLAVLAAGAAIAGMATQIPAATATPATDKPAAASQPAQQGVGAYDDTYYQDALGKTGQELKDALNGIISEQTTLSYDDVWEALKATDKDPANAGNVVLLYSGESRSGDANGGDQGDWNREHVWAKSHGDFGTSPGPGTDIHHLRPTDVTVNSIRGNKDFDAGGEEVDGAPGNFTDDDSYEPRDEVKGDVARMIFYMAVRYDGESHPDLELNDEVDNGSEPFMGRSSVLMQWHEADPPDDFEKNRNEVIYDQFQHNRNPFVDHPEWAADIWSAP